MRASGVISPIRSAKAPTNSAPEAASPAEKSAPRAPRSDVVVQPLVLPAAGRRRARLRPRRPPARGGGCRESPAPGPAFDGLVVLWRGHLLRIRGANATRASGGRPLRRAAAEVAATAIDLAYVREGEGGYPLLLAARLAGDEADLVAQHRAPRRAGFEVIVPDLRGFGDSGLAPDGFYDPAALARDLHALVHDVLGHDAAPPPAATSAASSSRTSALRFPGSSAAVLLQHRPADAARRLRGGRHRRPRPRRRAPRRPTTSCRRARDADGLVAELDTPDERRRYIAEFYGHRLWAAPGTFDAETSTS